LPVGEEPEVADAHEAARQQVQEETAQELVDRQSQEPLLVGVRGVSPAEGDVAMESWRDERVARPT
jgi:selenophosphate synthase